MTQPQFTRASIGPAQLAKIVARIAGQPEHWLAAVRYDASSRWYTRLATEEAYEVWLLSWLPGQQTGFHDHGPSAGAFSVTLGRLTERAVTSGRPDPVARTVRQGGVRKFGPDYIHNVRNDATEPAVSIHAYSPPLTSMRRFDVAPDGQLRSGVAVRVA